MSCRIPDAPRISSPTTVRDGTTILDIDHYAPFLVNAIGNAWQRKTSAIYRDRFGLSISEWRVLSMLNIEPGITAFRICEVIKMDKASVSRSLKLLSSLGLLTYEASPTDVRRRHWWLSDTGRAMHSDLMAVALECEAELVKGLGPEDLEVCLGAMRIMLKNFG